MNTATVDTFLFPDMPQATAKAPMSDFARLREFSSEHGGGLLPQQAAVALGISNARVLQLLEAGILTHVEVFGRKLISCNDVLTRMESRPPTGRPRGSLKAAIGLGVDLALAGLKK